MSTFRGILNRDERLLLQVFNCRDGEEEVIIHAHEHPTQKGWLRLPQEWGDDFEDVENVYQTAFDILVTVFKNERVAAIFCKSFAQDHLIDCGTTFEVTSQQVKHWLKRKREGIAA